VPPADTFPPVDVPDGQRKTLVRDRVDIEADGWDYSYSDSLSELELIEDCGLARAVQPDLC
jgi:hypothetical protein